MEDDKRQLCIKLILTVWEILYVIAKVVLWFWCGIGCLLKIESTLKIHFFQFKDYSGFEENLSFWCCLILFCGGCERFDKKYMIVAWKHLINQFYRGIGLEISIVLWTQIFKWSILMGFHAYTEITVVFCLVKYERPLNSGYMLQWIECHLPIKMLQVWFPSERRQMLTCPQATHWTQNYFFWSDCTLHGHSLHWRINEWMWL